MLSKLLLIRFPIVPDPLPHRPWEADFEIPGFSVGFLPDFSWFSHDFFSSFSSKAGANVI